MQPETLRYDYEQCYPPYQKEWPFLCGTVMTILMWITDKIITYYQKYKTENLIEFVTTEDHYQISQINTIPIADIVN